MKVEFGFQANCSEIITYLGASTREEVIAAMKKLQMATGWTWRIQGKLPGDGRPGARKHYFHVLVPADKLEELLVIEENLPSYPNERFGIWPDTVVPLWEGKLSPVIRKQMLEAQELCSRNAAGLDEYLCLADIPEEKPIFISRKDHPNFLSLDLWDGYNRRELNYMTFSHGGDFGGMHMITKIFGSSCFGHDGGSTREYDEWLKQSGLEEGEE